MRWMQWVVYRGQNLKPHCPSIPPCVERAIRCVLWARAVWASEGVLAPHAGGAQHQPVLLTDCDLSTKNRGWLSQDIKWLAPTVEKARGARLEASW